MKKAASVTLISVVGVFLVFSSSMSNPVATETVAEPLLAQLSQPQPIPLLDSTTRTTIGYLDLTTKYLMFTTRNIKIPLSGIDQVSKEDYELLRQRFGYCPKCPPSLKVGPTIHTVKPIYISVIGPAADQAAADHPAQPV